MTIPLIEILKHLVPNPRCTVWENDYNRIHWEDERPLPSLAEIEVARPIVEEKLAKENIIKEGQVNLPPMLLKAVFLLIKIALGIDTTASKTKLQNLYDLVQAERQKILDAGGIVD